MNLRYPLLGFLITFISLSACNRRVDINLPISAILEVPVPTIAVTIDQAISEIVGVCSFTAPADPASTLGIDYRVTFASAIDDSTFTVSDITNGGTGGSTTLTWSLTNCGDDTNFKLTATAVLGDGTILPTLPAARVQSSGGDSNMLSTATDNSVTFYRGWYQEAYIKAVNSEAGDRFGDDVSISGDTLAVSAVDESSNQATITNGVTASSDNSSAQSGAVYVYKRTGSNWIQEAYIKAVNSESGDIFGNSVSISNNTLAVGAVGEGSNQTFITNGATASVDNSLGNSGAVYIYKRSGSIWTQEAFIKAVNAGSGDFFGIRLKLSNNTLAVTAWLEGSNQTTITNGSTASGNNDAPASGAVYIYKRSGVNWAQEAYIKASNSQFTDFLGTSLSLEGDTLVAATPYEDSNQTTITNGPGSNIDNSNADSGAVYVYKRTGVNWVQEAYIKAVNNIAGNWFGQSVSLSGERLAVGSINEDSNQTTITNGAAASGDTSNANSGAVYVYKRTGVTWAQEAYIKATNNNPGDFFGQSVSLSGDTLVVGAIFEDSNQTTITNGVAASGDNSSANSGAVYVYKRTGVTWAQEAYIKASNSESNDNFGLSTDFSGDTIVVGTSAEDSNQTTITNGESASSDNSSAASGAVYVYRNRSRLFDVTELRTSVTSNSVTLDWEKSGGTSSGYFVTYQMGATAPADCLLGISFDAGDVTTFTEMTLSANTTYSFRVCATDGGDYSPGMTVTVTTDP